MSHHHVSLEYLVMNGEIGNTRNCLSYHAEISCLYKVPKKIRTKIILIVIRINNEGKLLNSDPCQNCRKVLNRKRIIVYYSNGNALY
jgi:cytidine deaminase